MDNPELAFGAPSFGKAAVTGSHLYLGVQISYCKNSITRAFITIIIFCKEGGGHLLVAAVFDNCRKKL